MKTLLKIFLLVMMCLPALAQNEPDGDEEVVQDPKVREKIKAARVAFITDRLGLTPEEAEKFWPVYREYSEKRQGLRQQLKDARTSGKNESELLELDLKLRQDELDLEKDYSGRLLKTISPQKLINLRQAEGDFRRLLLRQIQQRQNQTERRHQQRERSQQRQRNN
jgi:hypothetical protein